MMINTINSFIKTNRNFLTYSLIVLVLIPIFGLKFLIGFLSNIIILLFLVPLLFLVLVFIGINSLKSTINKCSNCGAVALGQSSTCINCGADLEDFSERNQLDKKASESTIEVTAEEIK